METLATGVGGPAPRRLARAITANVKEQFAVFGGSGAIVFGLLTLVVLAVLFRGAVNKVEERQTTAAR